MVVVSETPDGLLDTNIVLHAQTHDSLSEECRRFLAALERGELRARVEPLVLRELSYALARYAKQMSRPDIAEYLISMLRWPGVVGDKDGMIDALERWHQTPGLGFVDAYLSALANREGRVVFTKNVRDFVAQNVDVPDPLPEPTP